MQESTMNTGLFRIEELILNLSLFISQSFKIAKLCYLIMQNIFSIYVLLFSSNFDFCGAISNRCPSRSKQTFIPESYEITKLRSLTMQKIHSIYALLLFLSNFDFCASTLGIFLLEQIVIFVPKSFKIAKLRYLNMQNIYLRFMRYHFQAILIFALQPLWHFPLRTNRSIHS